MKREECKIGTFCIFEDRKVQILTKIQAGGLVGVGYDNNGEPHTFMVYYDELLSLDEEPVWLKRAKEASIDFKYGIEDELDAVWKSDLTEAQKRAKVERMMVTARHASERKNTYRATSAGKRFS